MCEEADILDVVVRLVLPLSFPLGFARMNSFENA